MIEKRYNDLEDTTPHEEYLLILSKSDACYGTKYSTIASNIENRIDGDDLTIQEYFHPLNKIDNTNRLIQNSVWIVHWEECLENDNYQSLDALLDNALFPNNAQAIICTEKGDREKANQIEKDYPGMDAAHSEVSLYSMAQIHFGHMNPCHTPGKKRVKAWNNEICRKLGI